MKNEREVKSSSSSSQPMNLDCDVVLGLKMQAQSSSESFHCDGGGSGVGLFLSNSSNQVQNFTDLFVPTTSLSLPRSFQRPAYRASGAGLVASGKSLFTASQFQEFERQNVIYKYIMDSVPVPPELLMSAPRFPLLAQLSQSNIRSDPEPWRCKRTDGKKWRCSRDVTPDQKYCERHAHKSRSRSRKHVEVSPKTALPSNPSSTQQQMQKPASQLPSMSSATPYDQTRSIEWLLRTGCSSSVSSVTIPVSTCNQQQWQQVLQSSSSSSPSIFELNRDSTPHNKNVPSYQYEDKQSLMSLNMTSLHSSERPEAKGFINAWEKESLTAALSKNFSPSSSLTLSMSAANSHDEDNSNGADGQPGIGMISLDKEQHVEGIMRPHWWLNPSPWMNSPPGGPLGEALCLGSGPSPSSTRVVSNLSSPHGYSNSSSCSKSSGDEGSHGLNFMG